MSFYLSLWRSEGFGRTLANDGGNSANEITLNANKKTIMPADVFKALEEIEFDFLKEPLEAEFASTLPRWEPYECMTFATPARDADALEYYTAPES